MDTATVNEKMECIVSESHKDRSELGKSRAFRSSMCGGGVVRGLMRGEGENPMHGPSVGFRVITSFSFISQSSERLRTPCALASIACIKTKIAYGFFFGLLLFLPYSFFACSIFLRKCM